MKWKAELKKEGFSELAIEEIEKYLDARCIDKSTDGLASLITACFEYTHSLSRYEEANQPIYAEDRLEDFIYRLEHKCIWVNWGEFLFYYPEDDRLI